MDPSINGLNIGIFVTDGCDPEAVHSVKEALEGEGATSKLVAGFRGEVHTDAGSTATPHAEQTFGEIYADAFDGLVLLGGAQNAIPPEHVPKLRELIDGADEEGKTVAAIWHGTALLTMAGVVEGRRITGDSALQSEIAAAGGTWVDEAVVVDGNFITARTLADLPAFIRAAIDAMAARMQANLAGKPDEGAVGIGSS